MFDFSLCLFVFVCLYFWLLFAFIVVCWVFDYGAFCLGVVLLACICSVVLVFVLVSCVVFQFVLV